MYLKRQCGWVWIWIYIQRKCTFYIQTLNEMYILSNIEMQLSWYPVKWNKHKLTLPLVWLYFFFCFISDILWSHFIGIWMCFYVIFQFPFLEVRLIQSISSDTEFSIYFVIRYKMWKVEKVRNWRIIMCFTNLLVDENLLELAVLVIVSRARSGCV